MKKVLAGALCVALLAALTTPAAAATEEGDQELSIAVIAQFTDGASTATVVAGFGYFVSDAFEIKGTISAILIEPDVGDTVTIIFFQLEALYHFNTQGDVVPYVGVFGGGTSFDSGDSDDTLFMGGGMMGAKFFLGESTTLFLEYRFLHIFEDLGGAEDIHSLMIGIAYFF